MKINSLQIKNFKSIVDVTIKEPNPFSVFIGPNASGKSNLFEAIEFFNYQRNLSDDNVRIFGGIESIEPFKNQEKGISNRISIFCIFNENFESYFNANFSKSKGDTFTYLNFLNEQLIKPMEQYEIDDKKYFLNESYIQFYNNYSKIFPSNKKAEKIEFNDDSKLSAACGNLEKVLRRVLSNESVREEIIEWLQLLIPGFENIEVAKSSLSDNVDVAIYEKGTKKPFGKNLISDGTYNILCLLTALYQSDKPQFLCIEEPENGLNPKVIKELVTLIRQKCEEGNFIWLNTHSQTLVSQLTEKEIIVVDKIDGETQIKQFPDGYAMGLPLDEAWFSNVLGGGNPW